MADDGVSIPPDVPPDEELTPGELHDRVKAATDLTADELRGFKASPFNDAYLDANSEQAQPGNEPLTDAITLLETPADQWSDADDGFNEVAQAEELLDFHRSKGALANDQGLGENFLTDAEAVTKREAALIRWGDDPDGIVEWQSE